MATLTSTPVVSPSSLTISGKTTVSATISWSSPSIPSGSTISSCVLSGVANASMSKSSATIKVNGTTVTSGSTFSINLGTSNSTTSVSATAVGGNKNASGTVTFSNLVYTVTYTAPLASYTVTFVDWDGSVLKTETVTESGSATAPSNPSRDGYEFTGWDKDFSNVTSNLTITAQYEELVYHTVTFIDWDGTVLKTEQVIDGGSATAPDDPTRDGYVFDKWNASFSNVTSDLTVTALYGRICIVTFVDWDGTVLKTEQVIVSKSATPPDDPVREGYTFIGWDINHEFIMDDTTITAQYEKIDASYHTVTFVDWDGTVLKTEQVEDGGSATAPDDPIRDGYTFIGWDVDYTNITSNLTVTAQYEKNAEQENVIRIHLGDIIVQNSYLGSLPIMAIYFNGQELYKRQDG